MMCIGEPLTVNQLKRLGVPHFGHHPGHGKQGRQTNEAQGGIK